MRTAIYLLATVAVAGLATAGTHHTGHPHSAGNPANNSANNSASNPAGNPFGPPGIPAPVRQPTIPPPAATPMPPPGVTPMPTQVTPHPQMTDRQMNNPVPPIGNNPASFQQRASAASRGVGNPGKPDCSRMRGIDKSECERRDTVRDDLPAGVTTTQPER